MKSLFFTIVLLLMVARVAWAKEPPDAASTVAAVDAVSLEPSNTFQTPSTPEQRRIVDKTFVGLAIISTGSTFADSYTTLFARQNWLGGKQGVCNMEVQSAYLYGTHPTAGRAYAVASIKSASSALTAYLLRKHHNRFWSAPLVINSIISLQGVGQNMAACN